MVQVQPAAPPQIEYTIYTFDMPKPKQKGANSWKKHSTLAEMEKAMAEALALHSTQKYQKIEVKKKFFDQKKNRTVDMTLKIYETTPKKDHTLMIFLILGIICAAAAFAASYFMTDGP